jgi:hypothetical protein
MPGFLSAVGEITYPPTLGKAHDHLLRNIQRDRPRIHPHLIGAAKIVYTPPANAVNPVSRSPVSAAVDNSDGGRPDTGEATSHCRLPGMSECARAPRIPRGS